MVYANRSAAGVALARAVTNIELQTPAIVLALPRGGVPVAFAVAQALSAPLDVMVVRKIGMPGQPELAIGAVASGGITVHEPRTASLVAALQIPFEELAEAARGELLHRERTYRADAPALGLAGKTAVLVDDGLATGSTMLAAVRAAREAGAASVVVAAPVASREAVALIRPEADDVIILQTPAFLSSIGEWYADFQQVEDAEVRALLSLRSAQNARPAGDDQSPATSRRDASDSTPDDTRTR